jgi:hypothetical protein
MKVLPTNQRSIKWLSTFFVALFLFSFNSLQAQDYVSSSEAEDLLADKVVQLDQQLDQGNISADDHKLNIKFVQYMLEDGLNRYDFESNASNSTRIANIYEELLQNIETHLLETHPQHSSTIASIKEDLKSLLQQ